MPEATAVARPELPARFQDWKLFEVGEQFIYAVDADDAEKAAALAAAAGNDFRTRTGREPSTRLILVADHDVWLPDGDPCRRLELIREGDAMLHRSRGGRDIAGAQRGSSAADGDRPDSCEELRAKSAELGVDPRDILSIIPHPVPMTRLVIDFGLPSDARALWDWAVMLPAEDCVDDGLENVMDAALSKELNFAQRMLAAPLLPFVRGVAVEAMLAAQKALLFELHAAAQSDWSDEERSKFTRDYEEALERDVEDAPSPP